MNLELADDVSEHGHAQPIGTLEGEVVEEPNRLEARGCKAGDPPLPSKAGVFADCFPRGTNLGGGAMVVEVGGHLLLAQWCANEPELPAEQRLLQDLLLRAGHTTLVIVGDAETMVVSSFVERHEPHERQRKPASLEELKARIKAWTSWAVRTPAPTPSVGGHRP